MNPRIAVPQRCNKIQETSEGFQLDSEDVFKGAHHGPRRRRSRPTGGPVEGPWRGYRRVTQMFNSGPLGEIVVYIT